jgi:predicted Zn-dependent peptidase
MPATLHEVMVGDIATPVIFEQDNRLPLVSMQLIFEHGGALTDTKPGLAKLASRLLGEGTKSMGSEAFAEALESRAITLQASVGAETFVISLNALKSEVAFGLEMLEKLLCDPNYTTEAFEKVQAQAIGMLTQKQSDFDYVANLLLKSVLFEGTPRAYPTSGTVESVEQITLEDVKRHIIQHLGHNNLIVVLGGDVEEEEVQGIVSKVSTALPTVSVTPLGLIEVTPRPKTAVKTAATEQAYVYFGAPYSMPYDSDEAYLGKVASFVLGSSGFGSRLMEEIRVKRGLAYSAYCSFSVNRTGSYFTGHLQTKLESAEEAKSVVLEVVAAFISKGITQEELDAAKQFLIGSEPLRNETLQQRIGNAFNAYYSGKPLDYRTTELRLIEAIELKQINAFIGSHTEIGQLSFAMVKA